MNLIQQVGIKRVIKYFFYSFWQIVFNWLTFHPLRIFWLKLFGAKIGPNTFIDKIDFINLDKTGIKGLKIGSNCFIGRGVLLDLAGKISLENFVTLSPRTCILSHFKIGLYNHPLLSKYHPTQGHTIIKKGSFIGAGSILLSGITVNSKSIIGAGSVVIKNVPSLTVVAGNPAKKIKKIK